MGDRDPAALAWPARRRRGRAPPTCWTSSRPPPICCAGWTPSTAAASLAPAGTAHLAVVVGLLRGGRYDEPTGRRLAAIAADAAGQAAWYQLECRPPAAARRSGCCSRPCGPPTPRATRARAPGILVHLAIGAFRACRPLATVDAMRAAHERTRGHDAPALHAMLLSWEARGHAKLGRRREAMRASGSAAELCARGGRRGRAGVAAAARPRATSTTRRAAATSTWATPARPPPCSTRPRGTLRPEQVRTRGLVLARAAAARLRLGDPSGAYRDGEQAVEVAVRIRSACLDEQIRFLTDAMPGLARGRAAGRPGG